MISKYIKKSFKAITRAYKALVSFSRVSNYQNKKIIEIWANSKHEQMYVFSIKAGFKQFLREFQKLIRKTIKQLKSKSKAKPEQKTSKISGIESKFKTHPYQERFINDNRRYVLSKLLVPPKSIKTRYDNCSKIEILSCDEPIKEKNKNTLVWFEEAKLLNDKQMEFLKTIGGTND